MNKQSKRVLTYFLALITIILMSVSFRSLALILDFNQKTGYFDDKILIRIANISLLVGLLFLSTYLFTAEKEKKLIASFATPATYIPTGAICTALALYAMNEIKLLSASGLSFGELFSAKNMARSVLVITVIMAVLAIGYFALAALIANAASATRAAFGMMLVLFLMFYASFLFFDTTLALNAPNKIIDQMAFVSAALFFLYEIRISLGRELWNLYMALGFISAALTAYSSIPSLIEYFANGTTVSNSIHENVITLCLFIFISSRILLATTLREAKESAVVSMIREYSEERNAETTSSNGAALESYLNLMHENEVLPKDAPKEVEKIEIAEEDLVELVAGEEPESTQSIYGKKEDEAQKPSAENEEAEAVTPTEDNEVTISESATTESVIIPDEALADASDKENSEKNKDGSSEE